VPTPAVVRGLGDARNKHLFADNVVADGPVSSINHLIRFETDVLIVLLGVIIGCVTLSILTSLSLGPEPRGVALEP
jgi:hypothetical protein